MKEEESTIKWEQFSSGDVTAYCWLYNEYIQILFQYGSRFTSDAELVKDCIQDIFTSLYKNRKGLGPSPKNVKVYLLVSLKNNLIRALQKRDRYDHVVLEATSFLLEPTIEDQMFKSESERNRHALIEKILSALSPRQKEIIYYRYLQEFDFDEICTLMQLNYQSCQNLLQRAVKKIREQFQSKAFYD